MTILFVKNTNYFQNRCPVTRIKAIRQKKNFQKRFKSVKKMIVEMILYAL